jgi:hypothetical protein
MRRVLVGLVAVMVAGASHAEETHSFTTVVNRMWWYQTLIHCVEPAKGGGRVPQSCILSEPATAYPNRMHPRPHLPGWGVACDAGYPIEFYPNGTLKYCKLDGEQTFQLIRPPDVGSCFDTAWFDENGLADCD